MLRAMLRDLRAHIGRVFMTVLAIVIGVGFVVATWVVSDSAAATFAGNSGRADLAAQVMPSQLDRQITEDQRATLAALPGVTAALGVRFGYAVPVDSSGKLLDIGSPEEGGTNWDSSSRLHLLAGRAPTGSDEVAIEHQAAVTAGLAVGTRARILLAGGQFSMATVVGEYEYGTIGLEWIPVLAYDDAVARTLLSATYERVDLFGGDQTAIASAATAALGSGFSAKTGTELANQAQADADSTAGAVRNFLLAFAGVALVVGMFVIANTFTMLVAQRTRQFALLRAVGATRTQVRRALLAEASALGGIGAVIGVVVGIGLGAVIMWILRGTGVSVKLVVSPAAILVGLAVGLAVTLVSAYGSARRAALVAPVAALRTDAALPRRSLMVRTVLGLLAIIAGVAAVLVSSHGDLTDEKRVIGMGGGLIAWLGVILLAPLLVNAVLRPLTQLLSRTSGNPGLRLALRNAVRDPRRTAATASALMIGVALMCAFATVGATFQAASASEIETTLPTSTIVVQSALDDNVLDPAVVSSASDPVSGSLAEYPAGVVPGQLRFGGQSIDDNMVGLDIAAIGETLTPTLDSRAADLSGGVLVPAPTAKKLGLAVGDQVAITAQGGTELTLPVRAIYEPSQILGGVVVSPDLLPTDVHIYHVYVRSSDPSATRAALAKTFSARPDVVVLDRAAIVDAALGPLELAFGIIDALLGAAILISIFGVVNTLALSVLERTREIGVLRAVGASRAFIRRSVRGESIVIATYGGLLGVVVGLLLGGVMQHVLLGQSVLDFTIPYQSVGLALVGMVVIGVVAAVWPARRASRTQVLTAIATE